MKSDGGKLDDAKLILAALGMPKAQQNPNAIYTFLAFASVGPRAAWSSASTPRLTPHDVIAFAGEKYGKTYAENTRETIRRQAIHQFVQGGILMRNPDEPGLATNSPRTHYALTAEALEVARAFRTPGFDDAAAKFREAQGGGLAERYAKPRRSAAVTAGRSARDRRYPPDTTWSPPRSGALRSVELLGRFASEIGREASRRWAVGRAARAVRLAVSVARSVGAGGASAGLGRLAGGARPVPWMRWPP